MICPSDESFAAILDGHARAGPPFHEHLESCASCFALVALLARSERSDLSAGQIVGHCRIEHLLGEGGMGLVFRATDLRLDRPVAVKTLLHLDPESRLHFKSEFRALRTITHPNLVSLGELFEHRDRCFFTMELVEGHDFLTHVRPSGSLDERRLRSALSQLAAGIGALHDARKVHRDLKPSNVLVEASGRAVILDFGLAVDLDDNAAAAGTLLFMAPEQIAGRAQPASDWYSVGVMLHLALTGRLPRSEPGDFPPDVAADLRQLCAELLRPDPAGRPTAGEVLRQLGGERKTTTWFGPTTRFFGRDAELTRLRTLISRMGEEESGIVALVHAPSGLGKTALVSELLRSLPPDTLVLSGRCHEREAVPYKALDEITDALSRHLAQLSTEEVAPLLPAEAALLGRAFPALRHCAAVSALPPIPSASSPQQQRERVFGAMRELLASLAQRRTLVLTIDDLQWTDRDSLELLRAIVDGPRMLLVLVVRSEAKVGAYTVDQIVEKLGREVETLSLGPLATDEARALADHLLSREMPHHSAADCDAIVAEAGGSPLFIDLLVRHRAADRPVGLAEALWERMRSLDDDAQLLLQLVSLAGGPITQEVARMATGLPGDRQAWLTGALCAQRFVNSSGLKPADIIEPYHDRMRETSVARMEESTRTELHRRLAVAFESVGTADPEQLGVHWHGAGEPKRAHDQFVRAAHASAEVLAFERAARLYERAMALDPEGRRELTIRMGDALIHAGHGYEGAQALLAAAALGDDIELRRRATEHLLKSGHLDEAMTAISQVLASVGMELARGPRRALLSLVARRVWRRLRGYRFTARSEASISAAELIRIDVCQSVAYGLTYLDSVRAVELAARCLSLTLQAGEPRRIALALCLEAASFSVGGVAARPQIEALLVKAERLAGDDRYARAMIGLVGGIARYHRGEWRRALGDFQMVEREWAALPGISFESTGTILFTFGAQFFLGELGKIRQRLPALLADADRRSDFFQGSQTRLSYYNAVWLAEGQPERARAEADRAMALWPVSGYHAMHYYHLFAHANVDLYLGGAGAWQRIEAQWSKLRRSLIMRIAPVRIAATFQRAQAALAAAAVSAEARGQALRAARSCSRKLHSNPTAWARVMADLVDTGLAIEGGEREVAIAVLRRAIAGLERQEMALHAAAARWQLGTLLGGDEGRTLVNDASRWMTGEGVGDVRCFSRILVAGQTPFSAS